MRESLFSNQVVQPFHLQNPFPLSKDTTDDRIFKTVSFRVDQDHISLRLKAINHNFEVVSELKEKEVNLSIPAQYWTPESKLRVKAKLAMEIDGVKESHWVAQQNLNYTEATTYNQYRIRGVSHEGYISDWIYSEARDSENNLILYELLYDIMDLLATAQDEQLEYLIDHMVSDTFQTVFQSGNPTPSTEWFSDEQKRAKFNEFVRLFSTELKQDFTETILTSPKEFSLLAKTYRLIETYQEAHTDFLALLLEAYLEERYEQLVQNTNFEVILRNDEELQLFLQTAYSMDIKNELIRHAFDLEPNDYFVTTLNDAVKLISEPVAYEQLVSSINEDVLQFFRMALQEIYVPFLVLDVRGAELEHELQDDIHPELSDDIVEFDLLNEGNVYKYELIKDLFDFFLSDLNLQHDYEIEIVEKIMKLISRDKVALLIEYNPVELIEFLAKVKEHFEASYTKHNNVMNELQIIQTKENITKNDTFMHHSLVEAYTLKKEEWQEISSLVAQNGIQDELYIGVMDFILNSIQMHESNTKEVLSAIAKEDVHHRSHIQKFKEAFIQKVLLAEGILKENQKQSMSQTENFEVSPHFGYENLVKPHLFHLYLNPYIEHKEQDLDTYLDDHYIMSGEEVVQYVLGDLGSGWPLGTFVLGVNTLKGDGSTSSGET